MPDGPARVERADPRHRDRALSLPAFSSSLRAVASGLAAEVPVLARVTAHPDMAMDAGTPVLAGMQLLLPSTPWDWPTDPNGTSSAALYDFCSWTPASAPPGPYEPSTTRFSDGYRLFLRCLQPDALTADALTAFGDERFYTTVLYAESGQPAMPAWNVSQFPQAWIAGVGSGSSTAGTIHVPLPEDGEPADAAPGSTCFAVVPAGGTATPVPLRAGAGQFLDIHADAWGLVSIRPAGWYDGALVAVKRAGPYATGDRDVFFGDGGGLRNLLTGMYVALRPTVTASVAPSFADALRHPVASGAQVRIGGLTFGSVGVGVGTGGRATGRLTSVDASSTASDAVVIGVTVASLGGGGA